MYVTNHADGWKNRNSFNKSVSVQNSPEIVEIMLFLILAGTDEAVLP